MPANRNATSRRAKGLLGALVLAASVFGGAGSASPGATHAAASGSGAAAAAAANLVRFAVDSPAMIQAELIATKYWGASPCGGAVSVSWTDLDPSINGSSTWWNPVSAYGNAGANSQCKITLNQVQDFDWPMFCTVIVHEVGHLLGQQHTTDPASVMYPVYVSPIPQCTGTEAGGAAPGPVAVRAASAKTKSVSTTHKAQSRHKKHKHHHKAKKKHA
jgi:hypothetical protein